VQGWGDSDDIVFRKLERWIGAHRAKPYLATLFTLSTHDPHVLPPGRPRVFAGEGHWANYVESLRFLDEELGRFYDWYLKNEASRGTVLVITGDHVPYLSPDRYTDDDELTRFDVPLIIHSPGFSTTRPLDDSTTRLGAHYDIPATILGLLDVSPGPCDQGVDLLLPDEQWPSERVVYSVAGDDLENFHVWFGDVHVHVDLATRTSTVTGTAKETSDFKKRAAEVLGMAGALSSYQVEANAFAPPPPTALVRRQALPSVAKPMFIAHRGQSRGGLPPSEQNKWKTIEQAIADGFTWIEVDLQLTRDDHPVLVHDARIEGREVPMLTLAELRALPGMADVLTLEEVVAKIHPNTGVFVEIKTQKNFHRNTLLARKAAATLRGKAATGRLVMDSFSPIIAASLKHYCRCPVGVDAPFGRAVEQRWIDDQARNGMDWIYVTFKQATPELVRYAHAQGLRVLVYTANDPVEIGHLRTEWPDAFMTDRAGFRSELPAL
jgi:glycerophosphoryl diester phosphodiesterase